MPWLINAAQVDKFRKSQKSLVILDASWFHPSDNRNAEAEFNDKHIIDAQFFDITAFADPHSEIPNMLIQDEKIISEKLSALGIRNDYKIILYDNSDIHTACRALWMLKMFGHNPNQLYILDGGLSAWEKYSGKVESGKPNISPKQYTAKIQTDALRTLSQVKNNLQHPTEQVIDVRHPVRFCGGKESRPNLRSGHIPGSFCFPYFSLFEADSTFRSLDKIRRQLIDVSIDVNSPMIITCGSGITAPILYFILDLMGHTQHSVYDGSWSEWGSEKLYPGEKSLDERPVQTCVD